MFLYWGGIKSIWGNKTCKYVYKYFFVFLSIQFLSIVFSKHCKVTANHKLICFKLLCISFHILISWMWGFTPIHPWTHFLSQAGAPVPHLLLGLLLLPMGQGDFPSEKLQLPLSLLEGHPFWGYTRSMSFWFAPSFSLPSPSLA